jgi:thiol-disulfide isomerase/thioredoxin
VLTAAAVALLGGCCGCGLPTQATQAGESGGSAAATPTPQAALTVWALDGQPIQIPGGRPTVLYFFSAGCRQCVSGARTLAQARKQTGPAATFLAVDRDPTQPPAVIRQFAAVAGDPDLPAASDRDAALGRRYQVTALSTLIVIDPAGTVTHRAVDPGVAPILAAIANATRP